MSDENTIQSSFWQEIPAPNDPFSTKSCFCHGYDVYNDLLGKASWIEYFYLMLTGKQISTEERFVLNATAMLIANPGPRDPSVRGAMNGAIGGSQSAACLMSALAIGAGQYGGAHEIFLMLDLYNTWETQLDTWLEKIPSYIDNAKDNETDAWLSLEHFPGFDPNGVQSTEAVRILFKLIMQANIDNESSELPTTLWLQKVQPQLEEKVGYPLALTGLVGAIFHDLGLNPMQGEMLFLVLRLPGAAAHALDQYNRKFHEYPFFGSALRILNDPKK